MTHFTSFQERRWTSRDGLKLFAREGIVTGYYGNPRQILFTVGYKL